MRPSYIVCQMWQNDLQDYRNVGELFYDPEYANNKGGTSFIYDESYIREKRNELDPKHIPITVPTGIYALPTGGGALPHYFQQFLPGEFAEQLLIDAVPNWNDKSQFEKLSSVAEIYGDFHALAISNYQSQINNDISSFETLVQTAQALQSYIKSDTKPKVNLEMLAALSNSSGVRPKLDYYDNTERKRYIVKLNNTPYCNDARVSTFLTDLQTAAGINSARSHVRSDEAGLDLLFQDNFSNIKDTSQELAVITKHNQVSFKVLLTNSKQASFRQHFTYKDIASAIKEYSAKPEEDLNELYRRAYFSASTNNTSNGLDNISMIDSGTNEWRLAPSYCNLPNPFFNTNFDIAFDDSLRSRNLFNVDDKFALRLADDMGLDSDTGMTLAKEVSTVIENAADFVKNHNLSKDDLSLLSDVLGSDAINKTKTKSKSSQNKLTP